MPKRQSVFDDLLALAAKLPWWVGVLLALASYLVLHLVAGIQIGSPKGVQGLGGAIFGPFVKMMATLGQYLLPLPFLIGAAVSAIRQLRERTSRSRSASPFDEYLRQRKKSGGKSESNESPTRSEGRVEPSWDSTPGDPYSAARIDTSRWTHELLAALEWKRFEEVCAGLFERLGFETKSTTHGADGGIDIVLFQPPSNMPVAIVQCKAWTSTVGVNVIRELRGVMASEGVTEGVFATTSTYSDDAIAFASANHIDLMDGTAVLDAILKLPDEHQASLLRLATAGDYTTPTCATCGVKMVSRKPKGGGKPFWGCVNYPDCRMLLNVAGAKAAL